MAAPQTVLDALDALVSDQADVVVKKTDKASKDVAAAEAAHAADVAGNDVKSASDKFAADKKALHDLIDSTFPTDAVVTS